MKNYLCLLLFIPKILFTQVVNIEQKRQSDERGWSGTTEFSFDYNSSEQIDWEFNNTSYLQWDNSNWSVLFLNEINFDRAGGIDFENDGFQHLRISSHMNSRITSETFIQNQFDPVRKIENRKLIGTGFRLKLVKGNFIGLSCFYEIERQTFELLNKDIRFSTYLQLDFNLSDKIQVFSNSYFQPNVQQFSDIKFSTESQLNFQIIKNFYLTNSLEILYDSSPVDGINKMAFSLQNGIKFNF